MLPRLLLIGLLSALPDIACAQYRVRTETITPPAAPETTPAETQTAPAAPPNKSNGRLPSPATAQPEIITDLTRLPPAVARTRERILAAARSGDLEKVVTVMQSSETMPIFSFGDDKSPIPYWKASYPDSDGIEVLAILVGILETGFVHIDPGTPRDMYVWPYFAFTPIKTLTPEQKVELFRIVTGSDYKEIADFGVYIFYRLGIAPDGTWHFFVAGD